GAEEVVAEQLLRQVLERVPGVVGVDVCVEIGAMQEKERQPLRQRHDEDDAIGRRAPPALRALEHSAGQRYPTPVRRVKGPRALRSIGGCGTTAPRRGGRTPSEAPAAATASRAPAPP